MVLLSSEKACMVRHFNKCHWHNGFLFLRAMRAGAATPLGVVFLLFSLLTNFAYIYVEQSADHFPRRSNLAEYYSFDGDHDPTAAANGEKRLSPVGQVIAEKSFAPEFDIRISFAQLKITSPVVGSSRLSRSDVSSTTLVFSYPTPFSSRPPPNTSLWG